MNELFVTSSNSFDPSGPETIVLGEALGAHLGVGPLALTGWEDALTRLLHLGATNNTPVVLDEFGYLLQAEPTLDSIIATLLGPSRRDAGGRTRLILCGSAIAMMRKLTDGQAPLRGRVGLELVMHPFDYREAASALWPVRAHPVD